VGYVVDWHKAFRLCHGYKLDNELILWSEGVIGTLSDEQEFSCKKIVIENAGFQVFDSVKDALKAKTIELPSKKLRQMAAIRQCAGILDRAEDAGLIIDREDVYSTMDYCMSKLGYNHVKWKPREDLREFIDEELEEVKVRSLRRG